MLKETKNYFFCKKYPFIKVRNVWNGHFMGYEYTRYDHIPEGWRKAFGMQLLEEIAKEFKKNKVPKRKWELYLQWQDIKEKWGQLCLYASAPEYIHNILRKYEKLSIKYCIYCGKPATHLTSGYILPVCDECDKS